MQRRMNPEEFMSMIGSGNLAKVEATLKENPTLISARGLKGMTPLHVAASQCRRSIARLLIKCGAEVNSKKDDGWTPLHHVCQNGDVNTVKLLLDSGADPNLKSNDDLTPLHSAAYGVSESTMSMLKSAVNMTEDGALLIEYAGVARELIQRGAELNPRNKSKGATPLVLALFRGQELVAKVLLENKAEVNAPSLDGGTPLHVAAARGSEAMVRLLVEKAADLEARDKMGRKPLDMVGLANDRTT